MESSDEKKALPRKPTSAAASRRSSRNGSPSRGLSRMLSGNFPDDHSQYHGHHYHHDTEAIDDPDSSDDSEPELTEKESQDTIDVENGSSSGEIIQEVRDGIVDDRDVEAGSKLEKTRTSRSGRSARDPNLVTWDGPNDPDNPKNWTFKHKWAATLIGKPELVHIMAVLTDYLKSPPSHLYRQCLPQWWHLRSAPWLRTCI